MCVTRSRRKVPPCVTIVHERLLGALDGKLPPEVLDTWIRPLRVLDVHDTRLELSVPNKFFRQHLEQRYLDAPPRRRGPRGRARGPSSSSRSTARRPCRRPRRRPPAAPPDLDPRYSFETFVVGSSNQFAQAACLAVAESPVEGLQPAVHLRGRGPRQDASAPGHRPPPRPEPPPPPDPVPLEREVHQRPDRGHPPRQDPGVPPALPDHRPPPDRRHPVPVRQGAHPGRVLPHLRTTSMPKRQIVLSSDRSPEGDPGPRGAPALPVPVGA